MLFAQSLELFLKYLFSDYLLATQVRLFNPDNFIKI